MATIAETQSELNRIRQEIAKLQRELAQLEKDLANSRANPALADLIPSQERNVARTQADIARLEQRAADVEANLRQLEANQASTKENNSGTGTPGTAGQGAAATKPTTTVPAPVAVPTDPDEIAKQEALAKSTPEKLNIKTDPGVKTGQAIDPASVGAQAGIPLLGDDGTVVQGFAINPETGQVYQTVDNTNQGLPGEVNTTRAQATLQDTTNFEQKADWRVRLSLSPGAYYLYKDESNELLAPLRGTDGIIFPYTPAVNVTYGANYQTNAPVHSNYKIFQYENSYVDTISITCDFTAQDTEEARYLLAVIHFLRSVTKMFYGQDFDPKPGTPPPLCYLFGLGEFQFNAHPLAITNFTYSLPNDVDYIRAGSLTEEAGQSRAQTADITKPTNTSIGSMLKNMATARLGQGIASVGSALGLRLQPGGTSQGYSFGSSNRFNSPVPPGTVEPTYVPTKININISAIPIVSRYEISNNFSVKDYANGSLLQGVKRAGGGFW
jgi:hypothetical protein